MAKLVLLRHGLSLWNKKNVFTGWIDIDLSAEGRKEAHKAGRKIRQSGIFFDKAYTSVLCRAYHTLDIVLKEIGQMDIPVRKNKALNERMYGDLQGKNKDDMREKFGAEQVHLWRRSFTVRPPHGESLSDTCKRTLPYYKKYIEKDLREGKNVLVAAHGNSLRSIVKHIEKLTGEQIVKVEIPTGVPYIYDMEKKGRALRISKKQILE